MSFPDGAAREQVSHEMILTGMGVPGFFGGVAVLLGVLTAASVPRLSSQTMGNDGAADRPVLVELFTSEGCSSCPPADELLIRLERAQPVQGVDIIAMSEHVDYWNDLGWRDPYSSTAFTERQEDYRRAFGAPASYTPQMVIDGRAAFVGSLENEARAAIAVAGVEPKALLRLEFHEGEAAGTQRVDVHVADIPGGDAGALELWMAIAETNLVSNVSRGENARRRLRHTAVVRRLDLVEVLAPVSGSTYRKAIPLTVSPDWDRGQLRVVVFLQHAVLRHVLGAAQVLLVP